MCTSSSRCVAVNIPELFDPATARWSVTGSMSSDRANHFGVRLPDGRVLVAGGVGNGTTNSAEIYDPSSGTWSAAASMASVRSNSTITLLHNGKVLVTGGGTATNAFGGQNTAELFDPASGKWATAGTMTTTRNLHTATLLPDGRVLVVGGADFADRTGNLRSSAEVYDPKTGAFTATGSMRTARGFHTATLLPNGKVLVTGGSNLSNIIYDSAELYDPASGEWSLAASMSGVRISHTATLLSNGKVLVAGGFNANATNSTYKSAEVYDWATGTWSAAPDLGFARGNHSATLLENGKVLVTGGNGAGSPGNDTTEIFDPATPQVATVSAASFARAAPVAAESIVTAFGSDLAGANVMVTDSFGITRPATLFGSTAGQISLQIPAGTPTGAAFVIVLRDQAAVAAGSLKIVETAPGLFSANGNSEGVAAATVLRVRADGGRNLEFVATFDTARGTFVPSPVNVGPESDQLFVTLYGTGLRFHSGMSNVKLTIGGTTAEVLYAGPTPGSIGLDQVNARLPRSLAGRGQLDVVVSVDGKTANTVQTIDPVMNPKLCRNSTRHSTSQRVAEQRSHRGFHHVRRSTTAANKTRWRR